jgi:Protein of unknown function (DUF3800)
MQLDARVYVDESYSLKDGVFYLAALIVPVEHEAALEAAWRDLRLEIKAEMADYFGAREFINDPDWLPELHAEALYQSEDEYEKYDKRNRTGSGIPVNDKDYWLNHVDWLEKALLTQAQFDLPLIIISGPHQVSPEMRGGNETLADMLQQSWNPDTPKPVYLQDTLEKMRDLESRAFTWSFPELLFHIEYELAKRGWQAEIICDDEEDNRGYRLATLLEDFYESGILGHVQRVLFEDSKTWTGLQVVDIHAYVFRRSEALRSGKVKKPKPTDARLVTWIPTICAQQLQLKDDADEVADHSEKIIPLVWEYIVMNSGGPIAFRQKTWEMIRSVTKKHNKYI